MPGNMVQLELLETLPVKIVSDPLDNNVVSMLMV